MAVMLDVKNINVYYGAIHAVKDISFQVNEGEIVTLIGANGAGKTTTLQTVSGLLHTRTGSIEFLGQPSRTSPPPSWWAADWPSAGGPPGLSADDSGGEPGDGRLHPARLHHRPRPGAGVRAVPPG